MTALKPKTIRFDATFEKHWLKHLKKLNEKEKEQLRERIGIFKEDVFDKRLKTHHLKGNLREYYAFQLVIPTESYSGCLMKKKSFSSK